MILLIVSLCFLTFTPSTGQPVCEGPASALYANSDLSSFTNCQQINGSLILGDRDCTRACTITDFSSLSNLQSITGSFVIQCCNTMTTVPTLPRLTQVQGTFRIYYNAGLRSISGLILATVGNLEISQNQLLQTIDGLQILTQVNGFLSVSYNPALTSITGLSSLVTIKGNQLLNDHALVLVYNVLLTDISGLKLLNAIEYGTVHIEGNTQLCYSGYPRWTYGSYGQRYSIGDKGIDWRTKLSAVNNWQFTWGGNGVPSLNIQDNGNSTICASATCHSSCPEGAGCLGPDSAELCGVCYQTSSISSCSQIQAPDDTQQTCVVLWPPTELPFSAIFGLVVALGGTLILIVLITVLVIACKLRKRFQDEKEGNYNINDAIESGDSHRQYQRNQYSTDNVPQQQQHTVYKNSTALEMETPRSNYEPVKATFGERKATVEAEVHLSSHQETRNWDYDEESSEHDEEEEEEESVNDREEETDFRVEYEFPSRKVHLTKEIGQGKFGRVYEALANDILPNEKETQVVVKQCQSTSNVAMENFLESAEKMRHLKHENVLHLLGVCTDGPNMLIIVENCINGNLKSFLQKKRSRLALWKKNGNLLNIMIDMAKGLHYLHEMSIAHNDFAARNCLVCANNRIKVGDYDLSRQIFRADYYTRTPGQMSWPVRWMAPEIILDRDGILDSGAETRESNIWSFGISMWEVCTCAEQPYSNMTDEEVIEQLSRRHFCNLMNPVPASDPLNSLFVIMMKCWKEPRQRPSMEAVLDRLTKVTVNIDKAEGSRQSSAEAKRWSGDSHKQRSSLSGNDPKKSQKKTYRTSQQQPLISQESFENNEEEETVKPRRETVEPRRETVEPRRETVEPRREIVEPRREDYPTAFSQPAKTVDVTNNRPSPSLPTYTTNRYSKESWDSFDDDEDEETDYPRPPPPNDFSQDEEHEETDAHIGMLDMAAQSSQTNEWEESEPITPVKFDSTKERIADPAVHLSDDEEIELPPLQEDDIESDEYNTEPIEPVNLDLIQDQVPEDSDEVDDKPLARESIGLEDSDEINVPVTPEETVKSKGKRKESKKEKKGKEKKKESKEQKKKEKHKKSKKKPTDEEKDEGAMVW